MTDIPTNQSSELAREVYQALLDVTSRQVMEGKAADYCAHIMLPYVFRTQASEQIIETKEDLAADIEQITAWLVSHKVTDYLRIARTARFIDDATIEGFHVTYALRGTVPVIEPYANRTILKLKDAAWRIAFAEHEISDALYPGHNARPAPGVFTPRWVDTRGAPTRDPHQAMPIYQAMIDEMSRAIMASDFESWAGQFTYPVQVHYDASDHVAQTSEDTRAFFKTMLESMQKAGADTITRTATYAAFVSDDRLLGYHDTTMVKDGEPRLGPIKSRMILVRKDGRWLCTSVANSLSNAELPAGQFRLTALLPTIRQIQERMKT